MKVFRVIFFSFFILLAQQVIAQNDSVLVVIDSANIEMADDSLKAVEKEIKETHSPRKAVIRSAILPGWGQIYNKKYWKLPIVYGALGTSAGIFMFNMKWYKRTRFAYKVLAEKDSANFDNVHPQLQPFVTAGRSEDLRYARDSYRQDIDYSVLFFIALWGLNVVDAAVDAHLKGFDVSPDLSFKIKPGYSEMAGTNGISFILKFK